MARSDALRRTSASSSRRMLACLSIPVRYFRSGLYKYLPLVIATCEIALTSQVSEISGGITNILWKVAPAERLRLEPVVLRVFGKQTDKIIDRYNEQKVLLQVNKAGFGAKVCALPFPSHSTAGQGGSDQELRCCRSLLRLKTAGLRPSCTCGR